MANYGNIAKRATPRARKILSLSNPLVVGVAHTWKGVKMAAQLKPTDADIVELRIDALLEHESGLEALAQSIRLPILLTVRHPAEGGVGALSLARRRSLIEQFLPYATLLDVELRSVETLAEPIRAAREQGAGIVISDHHFRRCPSEAEMAERQRRAFRAGADVFKLAALLPSARAFARLLAFAARPAIRPRALMGMGRFGQISRLALGQAGSVLNYGFLDRPNAPGQWEARELKQLLARIESPGSAR